MKGRKRTVSADWIVPLRQELGELRMACSRSLGRAAAAPQAWPAPPVAQMPGTRSSRIPGTRRSGARRPPQVAVQSRGQSPQRTRHGASGARYAHAMHASEVLASAPPMLDARDLLNAAVDYIRRNPDELVKAAVNAAGLRFGVPLAALRYLSSQAKLPRKAPKDIDIGSSPPAIRISLSVDAMGTPVRASAAIKIDEIDFSPDSMRIGMQAERREARPARRERRARRDAHQVRRARPVQARQPGEVPAEAAAAPSSRPTATASWST